MACLRQVLKTRPLEVPPSAYSVGQIFGAGGAIIRNGKRGKRRKESEEKRRKEGGKKGEKKGKEEIVGLISKQKDTKKS